MVIPRKLDLLNRSKYSSLKNFHNIYKNKRCFIVATGPSLTVQDCNKLKNEYTFGMNSLIDLFDKTDWRPTFYVVQDINVYRKIKDRLYSRQKSNIFLGSVISEKFSLPQDINVFHNNQLNHRVMYYHKKYYTRFSDNAYATVYDGYSITYSVIQLAVYMGFNEIYLIGCDNSIDYRSTDHFKECKTFVSDKYLASFTERSTIGYMEAKKYADIHNIRIYNATRGGYLEVFPRVLLDNIIANRTYNEE